MLEIRNCTKSFNGKRILSDINLEIRDKSIVSFLGPSGSGKTTLMRAIMGLEHLDDGFVRLDGMLLSDGNRIIVKPEKRCFSIVFQDFILFPHFDVYRNIVIGLDHIDQQEKRKIADELLEMFEIAHLAHRAVDTLSGGEQQRVAISRALAVRPKLIMFDEPFSNIDRKMKERLSGKLKEILARYSMTAIFATHDHGEAFFFSDKIYVLKDGRIEDGNSPYFLYTRPATPWVASFIGEVNYISGYDLKTVFRIDSSKGINDSSYCLVRPEEFLISKDNRPENPGTIEAIEYYGFYRTVIVIMGGGKKIRVKDFLSTEFVVGEKVDVRIAKTVESISLTETSDYQGEGL